MTTEERLEKLERELADPKRCIRASGFVLEDENGKVRASLGVGKQGPGLALFDENGKVRVGLRLDKGTSGLDLYDENGKMHAALGVAKGVATLLLMLNDGEGVGMALTVIKDKGRSDLTMFDENGKTRVVLGVNNRDGPGVGFLDENGKIIGQAP